MRLKHTLPPTIDEILYDFCSGKPAGGLHIPKVGTRYHGYVIYDCNVKGHRHRKHFRISECEGGEDAAIRKATEYGIRWSDENGLTKNRVRRLPDGVHWQGNKYNVPVTKNTLEVFIDDEHTMLIDFEDLEQVQNHCVHKTDEGYARFNIDGKTKYVHRFLTGYDLVDHFNRNPLDNRRVNLHKTTPKENSNNRTCKKGGVYFDNANQRWIAHIQQDGKRESKCFSVNKYGEQAYEMAVNARKELLKKYGSLNSGPRELHQQTQ